jgi:hypothetical protein
MTAAGKIIDNRAVGAVIAGTGFRQRSSCSRIACSSMMWRSIRHFLQRAFFHVGAVPRRIVEQVHQLAALFQIKPDLRAWRSSVSSSRCCCCSCGSRFRCAAAASPAPSLHKSESLCWLSRFFRHIADIHISLTFPLLEGLTFITVSEKSYSGQSTDQNYSGVLLCLTLST